MPTTKIPACANETSPVLTDAELLTRLGGLFAKRLVTSQDKYDRAADFVSARTRGIGSTAQVLAINAMLRAKDKNATPTTAGNISHYLKAWDLVLEAGIVPIGRVELMAAAYGAISWKLKLDQRDAMIVRLLALPVEARESAMIAEIADPKKVEKTAPTVGLIDPEDVSDPASIKGVVEKSRAGFAETINAMLPNIGGLTAAELSELIESAQALIEAAQGLVKDATAAAIEARDAEWAAEDAAAAALAVRKAARELVTA